MQLFQLEKDAFQSLLCAGTPVTAVTASLLSTKGRKLAASRSIAPLRMLLSMATSIEGIVPVFVSASQPRVVKERKNMCLVRPAGVSFGGRERPTRERADERTRAVKEGLDWIGKRK